MSRSGTSTGWRIRLTHAFVLNRFSATWPYEVRSLAGEFLNNIIHITVGNEDTSAALSIEQRITICDSDYEKEEK